MQLKPKLTKAVYSSSVEWEGDTVDFSAKRHCLTPKMMEQFKGIEEHPMRMAEVLANILTEWSYTDVDCTNAEELGAFAPVELLTKFIEKLGEVWSGEKKPQAASQNG